MKKNSHLTTIAISLIHLSEIRPKSSLLSSWKSDVDKKCARISLRGSFPILVWKVLNVELETLR